MTKERLVNLFQESFSGNRLTDDKLAALDEDLIAMYLSFGMETLINRLVTRNHAEYSSILSDFTHTEEKVDYEKIADGTYVLKPKLKGISTVNQEGIRSIYPHLQPENAFTYRNQASEKGKSILQKSLGYTLTGTYNVSPDRVIVKSNISCESFDMRVVATFDSLDWDVDIKLPQKGEVDLFQITKQLYFGVPPEDKVNDER
ncbi:MAG: hypothetical protein ACI9DM_000256 [Cyclobacteriaceae bacterium]|jgi:hypothetical protein